MALQIVRPAGAGHETLAVIGAALLIVAAAASYIGLGTGLADAPPLPDSQLDARRDLTPAEQGIYADLRVVHDELRYVQESGQPLPDAAALAEAGLPPFAQDAASTARGGHVWSDVRADGGPAYLGQTRQPDVAGSFLMIAPHAGPAAGAATHAHDHPAPDAGEMAQPDIWLHRADGARVPARLDAVALAQAGWRQVLAQFDAGVTRQSRP